MPADSSREFEGCWNQIVPLIWKLWSVWKVFHLLVAPIITKNYLFKKCVVQNKMTLCSAEIHSCWLWWCMEGFNFREKSSELRNLLKENPIFLVHNAVEWYRVRVILFQQLNSKPWRALDADTGRKQNCEARIKVSCRLRTREFWHGLRDVKDYLAVQDSCHWNFVLLSMLLCFI